MINDIIKKYEIKEKHKIYMKNLIGKNHEYKKKLHYKFKKDY